MTEVVRVEKEPNWFKRHKVWTVVIAVFILFSIVGAVGGDDDKKVVNTETDSSISTSGDGTPKVAGVIKDTPPTVTAPSPTTAPPTAKTPAPAPVPTPAAPSATVSQKNALNKAKSYLAYSAFSHDGLVNQLVYEQFSTADASYGADNVGANWNEQAAKKAKSYMDYSSFSRGSLISQLEYEKFTTAQATYGADSVGL